MSAKVSDISGRRQANDEAALSALEAEALEISAQRDNTERTAIELLRKGRDQEALRILRKHWGIEPRMKIAK